MVKPGSQLLHMAAPCLVQADPVLGEPFGQLHVLAHSFPDEPVNKTFLSAFEVFHSPQRVWSNFRALWNM